MFMITFDIIQSVIDAIGPLELYVSLCSCWIFIFCIFFLSESPLLSSKAKGRILPSPSLMPIITSFKEIKRANFCTLVSMDSVKPSAVMPRKSRLARTVAKVLHVRALTGGVSADDGVQKSKNGLSRKMKHFDDADELLERQARAAFLATVFASISAVKAAYAELQYAQFPYDGEGIQSADQAIVSELKKLSELKQCYLKKNLSTVMPPDRTLLFCEIQEQMSLLKTYEITGKKLESELRLKDSEITFLKEKLAEANSENELLNKRLNSSGHLAMPDNIRLSGLRPSHFITYFRDTVKSIRSFVHRLIGEMESAGWDVESAASSIVSGVPFWKSSHICFTFESFICRHMFDDFNHPNFSTQLGTSSDNAKLRQLFFDRFMELKSVKPEDHLAWKPKSAFAAFCRSKFFKLVHPKMEGLLFGNLNQRTLLSACEVPETVFFRAFSNMAKHVWLLHCLAFAFDPTVEIFSVSKMERFSEVCMESLCNEVFFSDLDRDPQVAFVTVPGFRLGRTIIQCHVYLR